MALKKDRELKGLDVPAAYCRIDWLRFDGPNRVGVGLGVYASEWYRAEPNPLHE